MKLRKGSLAEIAAQAATQLEAAGIPVAVVGGSAITVHAPRAYTSMDIDFAATKGTTRRAFGEAIAPLGFSPRGRDFVHAASVYSLDLVADTPFIDQRPIKDFAVVRTRYGRVRVYKFEDAIADRIAAFVHWADEQSLSVAERAIRAAPRSSSWSAIDGALLQLDADDAESERRLNSARDRLRRVHKNARALSGRSTGKRQGRR